MGWIGVGAGGEAVGGECGLAWNARNEAWVIVTWALVTAGVDSNLVFNLLSSDASLAPPSGRRRGGL